MSLSRDLAKAAKALEAPIWWLRGLIVAAFVAGVLMFLFVGTILPLDRISGSDDAVAIGAGHRGLDQHRSSSPCSACSR